ncbi:hypothetical protein, conserved [Eimeria tenella]|uniref:Uncharacterized protein n=1 Tax=Eimeria tenella TaxID=5802 RepID=U6L2Q0_EIMTE|nr:hypothetical protein, conserved [Eimeria tenella]CDJ42045.1 hypothetical protein, conserved [Eimeria tenella]|eukprot:XP_013232795.1 hypothetical protein, conserved [Eimeria tenella]
MGICCIFFMSAGGLVLGVISCTVGCALGFLPFALYKTQRRLWGVLSVISLSALMVLLFATFGYGLWLLLQNLWAQSDMNTGYSSPLVVPCLDAYIQKAGQSYQAFIQTSQGSMNPSATQTPNGRVSDASDLAGNDGVSSSTTTETTTTPTSTQMPEEENRTNGQPGNSSTEAEEEAPHQSAAETPENILEPQDGGAQTTPSGNIMKSFIDVAKKQIASAFQREQSPFYPTLLRQSWTGMENILVTSSDLQCVQAMGTSTEALEAAEKFFRTFLDWGLFCGFTQYTFSVVRKWPMSCVDDCNFGKLHLSKYRSNEDQAKEHAEEFIEDLEEMTPDQVQGCILLATVTTCRIQQKNLDNIAISAMCISLVFAILIFFAAVKCLVDCSKFVGKHAKGSHGETVQLADRRR